MRGRGWRIIEWGRVGIGLEALRWKGDAAEVLLEMACEMLSGVRMTMCSSS